MASSFTVRYSGNVTPYEIVTLADGTTTIKALHSLIDKSIGGSIEKVIGDTASFVKYIAYLTTTSAVPFNDPRIFNIEATLNFLSVRILSAGSSGVPTVQLTIDGTNFDITLYGIGDFCIIPMNVVNMANVQIKSNGATTVANVEIMVAEEA